MKSIMIRHPGARTRALYRWEESELQHLRDNHPISENEARAIRDVLWLRHQVKRPAPALVIKGHGSASATGYSLIQLTEDQHDIMTCIHEITHARGYGSRTDTHNVAFVMAYLDDLEWWFDVSTGDLFRSALVKGLLPWH